MNRLRRAFVKQFSHPTGLLGELAGYVMANRSSNLERNEWTIGLLDLKPDDAVLEIGPGPGVTLGKLLKAVPNGTVTALDHSSTMLRQCRRRNRLATRSGRLVLVEASYAQLDCLQTTFDKIIAVNSLQFSGVDEHVFRQLHALLNPGARLAMTYQSRGANVSNAAGMAFAERACGPLADAGFSMTDIHVMPLEPVNAFCVLASK